jgi:hypothetical protein
MKQLSCLLACACFYREIQCETHGGNECPFIAPLFIAFPTEIRTVAQDVHLSLLQLLKQ